MQGCVSHISKEKGWGFINGTDGYKYFFHVSSLTDSTFNQLVEGTVLEFIADENDKGLVAKQIKLINLTPPETYDIRFGIQFSKSNQVADHEVIDISDWYVTGSGRGAPDNAKQQALQRAQLVGANAVLNWHYFTSVGSEPGAGKGTHHYTIHHYRGRLAIVGRKNPNGKYQKSELQGTLNKKAAIIKQRLSIKTKKKQAIVFPLMLIGAALGAYIGHTFIADEYESLPIAELVSGVLCVFGIYKVSGTLDYDHWLTSSNYEY
jgi:cold shock CspA family protein